MGDAATPALPDFTSQTASQYKANIDAGFAVADRLAWAFTPHEQATPDMTVRLEAGATFDGTTLTEVAAQSTPAIAAPTTNPRIDRIVIDRATGAVLVVTGTEAAAPTSPAIPAGKAPVAQVSLSVGQTAILNTDITDERNLGLLGLGTLAERDAVGASDIADGAVTTAKIAVGPAGVLKSDGASVSWASVDLPRGYIDGLVLSRNATNPTTQIDIAPGQATDSTNASSLALSAVMTKAISAAWAAGSGAGGLFSGTVTASTWYHVFLIEKDADGSIDAGFDTDVAAANRPAGYTRYRRIGSGKTDGAANLIDFVQHGDTFLWTTVPALDVNDGSLFSTRKTYTLASVPSGIAVIALLNVYTLSRVVILLPPEAADQEPSPITSPLFTTANLPAATPASVGAGQASFKTNASAQITARSDSASAAATLRIAVLGWIDPRGRNA